MPVSSAAVLHNGRAAIGISNCEPGICLDLTRGLEIWTYLQFLTDTSFENHHNHHIDNWLEIVAGYGVGKVDLTGQICLSHFARDLLLLNLKSYKKSGSILKLEIIFPTGKDLSERTSNHAFGVVDGLALIGMQAEVQVSASPDQLQHTISLLKAICKKPKFNGSLTFVIGENGLDIAQNKGLDIDFVIKTGNWLGPLLVAAAKEKVTKLLLWGYHGKLVKLAGGIFHTHHHLADGRLEVLIALAVKEDIPLELIKSLSEKTSLESAFLFLQENSPQLANRLWFRLAKEIEAKSTNYVNRYVVSSAIEIGVVLFDRQRKLRWAGPIGLQRINSLDVTLEV